MIMIMMGSRCACYSVLIQISLTGLLFCQTNVGCGRCGVKQKMCRQRIIGVGSKARTSEQRVGAKEPLPVVLITERDVCVAAQTYPLSFYEEKDKYKEKYKDKDKYKYKEKYKEKYKDKDNAADYRKRCVYPK